MNYKKVNSLDQCSHVKVTPNAHKGDKQIVPLIKTDTQIYFLYQQRKYIYNQNENKFVKIDLHLNETFGFYKKTAKNQLRNDSWVKEMLDKYGSNHFELPLPTFKELYIEQALAPFFVFQVFCVCLWLLDEYWYYAIFILIMLLTFEATVVSSRLKNLVSLRSMVHKEHNMQVHRNGKWTTISNRQLVPGDICYIPPRFEETLPADFLLLSGSCITNEAMLTGESTPQLKECCSSREDHAKFSFNSDSAHILFGGTKIVQTGSDEGNETWKVNEKGCVCYVLRNGFNTSQGKLIRTILFSTQRVTANNFESFVFICFLLCFGIVASSYVLINGLADPTRSRYKLLLECSLIITSTVPPELPTELNLAVNNSIQNLQTMNIFCTEPFRIPFAGKVDVCCFDKTGTLTDEHLVLAGVAGIVPEAPNELVEGVEVYKYNEHASFVMAGCHSLTNIDKETIGDPMEIATLYGVNWNFSQGDVAVARSGERRLLRILFRHHFNSSLARMSTIVSVEKDTTPQFYSLVKGSPEVIMARLSNVPAHFKSTYLHYAAQGKRVIAMAYKNMPRSVKEQARNISREDIERDLEFCGFLIFECPLKSDSKVSIEILTESSHKVLMITGDNPLTASEVASTLGITSHPVLVLEKKGPNFHWTELTNIIGFDKDKIKAENSFPFNENGIDAELANSYDFCVYGEGLSHVLSLPQKKRILSFVKVFARSTPENKTAILTLLKSSGSTTLMCGDGTNDVGALKQANVGVALLNNLPPKPEDIKPQKKEKKDFIDLDAGPKGTKVKRAKAKHAEKGPKVIKMTKSKMNKLKREYEKKMEEIKLAEKNNPSVVNLGDASIASPFTAKTSSVLSVTHIIRQGRCTLIATRQMFSILALNCLVHAYALSVLYIDGIKLGDRQSTLTGLLVATCFMAITNSKPVEELSKKKPHSSLFSLYLFASIIGQFVIHLYALMTVVSNASFHLKEKPKSDSEFSPNFVNSVVFLITTSMQVSTFATNYVGEPYMESLRENKTLFRCLVGCCLVTFFAASEFVPSFNAFLQLAPLPPGLKGNLLLVMVVDYIAAFVWERLCRKVLASKNY